MRATPSQIGQLLALAEASPHAEVCGVVLDSGRLWPCRNIAAKPADQFELDPVDYAAAERLGRVAGIWHSHPSGGAEPSMIDRAMCERTRLPWHIVSAPDGDYRLIEPCGWLAPYTGRPYCYGLFDCWEIIRDWQRRERGVELWRKPGTADGWWATHDWSEECIAAAGLVPVAGELQPGDILFMWCDPASVGPDHAAVYVGNGRILHQLRNRPSDYSIYGGHWQRVTTHRLRLQP